MTNLSYSPSQDQLSSSPTTTVIESLEELAEAIAAKEQEKASVPRSTSTSGSNLPTRMALCSLNPGDYYDAPLNDEVDDGEAADEQEQPAEGNKRRRERRRRSPISVECHPFFNGSYLAYLEEQVHKKKTNTQNEDENNEENPTLPTPPNFIAEKTHENAYGWNERRRVRRARRQGGRNGSSRAASSA